MSLRCGERYVYGAWCGVVCVCLMCLSGVWCAVCVWGCDVCVGVCSVCGMSVYGMYVFGVFGVLVCVVWWVVLMVCECCGVCVCVWWGVMCVFVGCVCMWQSQGSGGGQRRR